VTARFGEYTLDDGRRELLRGASPVHLTPKAYELLKLLLERRPAAVSKAEIHDRIWPGTFVSDVNLATLVFEIRGAIGDDPHAPRYIRTVRAFGYAFCAEGAPASAAAVAPLHARLIWGEREIALREGENILGRTPEAVVWLDHGSISRHHARVELRDGEATIEDLGSRHGTQVDGVRIETKTPLHDGACISLGGVSLRFRVFDLAETDSREE